MDPDQITQAEPVSEIVPASIVPDAAEPVAAVAAPELDPAIAELCAPLGGEDACGPDLDLDGDAEYLGFLAAAEGVLPSSFFSAEDGRPFDRSTVDIAGQLKNLKPLLGRTRDLRLLIMRARLQILDRDLAGFAGSVAVVAELLERFWDDVHPRCPGGDTSARSMVIAALEVPTVIFPLQYTPLFETRRIGAISYRTFMIATDEAKPRDGEQKLAAAAIIEARGDADPSSLATTRRDIALLGSSIDRIRSAFAVHGASADLANIQALVSKIHAFIDPVAAESGAKRTAEDNDATVVDAAQGTSFKAVGAPGSLSEARAALAAIADYYTRREPSSPALPLVSQAHQLIGKSFFEVISVLVPTHLEKAAFQIGGDQVFDLPLGKLPKSGANGSEQAEDGQSTSGAQFDVQTRAQAIALLDQVQRYFRHFEPSSPVPMLCDRARALAERDFMAVLRDVLPKAALKSLGSEK